jgi:osomolarity two-component system sensor histidine kinase SLN1
VSPRRQANLALVASLYASQLHSNLFLLNTAVEASSTRVLIQSALQRYNDGNSTDANWYRATQDLQIGLGGSGLLSSLLQARIVSKNGTGTLGPYGLVNVSATDDAPIPLPETYPNGTQVHLGDSDMDGLGYPSNLYPNLTFTSTVFNGTFNISTAYFNGKTLYENTTIFIGPWLLNETFGLASITVPINNNTSASDTLGWLTVITSCQTLFSVAASVEGLGKTGQVLILGPDTPDNRLLGLAEYDNNNDSINIATVENEPVVFVLPPVRNLSRSNRQSSHTYGSSNTPFAMRDYPAVLDAYTDNNGVDRSAGSLISSKNEEGKTVSVGYALPMSAMVDWAIVVEQSHAEVTEPITKLRKILLACVFGTTGGLLILLFPIAHLSVLPIRRLREATKQTVEPYQDTSDDGSIRSPMSGDNGRLGLGDNEELATEARKEGFFGRAIQWRSRHRQREAQRQDLRRRQTFHIPGRVKTRKHFVQDELTDLTTTFNGMSEELMMQYERLEERVKERTQQLEISKKAAEAANESKTLFIANISHELKTPLNGILGMCAVCMQEDEPSKIKRSLGIIYKSGDLLLHLLTDLLTFSKNQIGQQLTLEEKEFRLADVSSQVLSIFEKQAREGDIKLSLHFLGPLDTMESSIGNPFQTGLGPFGTGRVRDMCVWGDQHRILQVIINLVSNSLKFTPPGGTVQVRVRCTGEVLEKAESRRGSLISKKSNRASLRTRTRRGRIASGPSSSTSPKFVGRDSSQYSDPALQVDKVEPKAVPAVMVQERSSSPPPVNARTFMFEFEVEDTGPGIPEAQQQRVFEPFMQGDLGLSKKYGGTGLGLSICSQLAGLMNGSISLKSEVGVGSTFTMRIPLIYTKERAESLQSVNANPGSQRNSISLGNGDESKSQTRHRSGSSGDESDDGSKDPVPLNGFDTPAKPRLVGLSQPFFAVTSPLESPENQMAAMEEAAAQASKSGDKVRVLVAEDNKVNQEVVLRMLKLEDIYGAFSA